MQIHTLFRMLQVHHRPHLTNLLYAIYDRIAVYVHFPGSIYILSLRLQIVLKGDEILRSPGPVEFLQIEDSRMQRSQSEFRIRAEEAAIQSAAEEGTVGHVLTEGVFQGPDRLLIIAAGLQEVSVAVAYADTDAGIPCQFFDESRRVGIRIVGFRRLQTADQIVPGDHCNRTGALTIYILLHIRQVLQVLHRQLYIVIIHCADEEAEGSISIPVLKFTYLHDIVCLIGALLNQRIQDHLRQVTSVIRRGRRIDPMQVLNNHVHQLQILRINLPIEGDHQLANQLPFPTAVRIHNCPVIRPCQVILKDQIVNLLINILIEGNIRTLPKIFDGKKTASFQFLPERIIISRFLRGGNSQNVILLVHDVGRSEEVPADIHNALFCIRQMNRKLEIELQLTIIIKGGFDLIKDIFDVFTGYMDNIIPIRKNDGIVIIRSEEIGIPCHIDELRTGRRGGGEHPDAFQDWISFTDDGHWTIPAETSFDQMHADLHHSFIRSVQIMCQKNEMFMFPPYIIS